MRDRIILIGSAVAAIVIGVLIFAYTTKTASKTPLPVVETTPSVSVIPFIKLAEGKQSAITRRVNYFITSQEELSRLWKTVGATSTPPIVDFKVQMVLAIFAGTEQSAAVAVAKVEDSSARMVSIAIEKLEGSCVKKQSAATPYELVVVPMTSLPLAHTDTIATTSCPK